MRRGAADQQRADRIAWQRSQDEQTDYQRAIDQAGEAEGIAIDRHRGIQPHVPNQHLRCLGGISGAYGTIFTPKPLPRH